MAKLLKVKTSLNENGIPEIEARGHKVLSDVGADKGGSDQGLLPGELLIGSLGACQLLVAKFNAKRFDIDLQGLSVELEAEGGIEETNGRQYLPNIKFSIHVESNSPEEKVKEFIEFVENNCPIGATLANAVNVVQTELLVKQPVNK